MFLPMTDVARMLQRQYYPEWTLGHGNLLIRLYTIYL